MGAPATALQPQKHKHDHSSKWYRHKHSRNHKHKHRYERLQCNREGLRTSHWRWKQFQCLVGRREGHNTATNGGCASRAPDKQKRQTAVKTTPTLAKWKERMDYRRLGKKEQGARQLVLATAGEVTLACCQGRGWKFQPNPPSVPRLSAVGRCCTASEVRRIRGTLKSETKGRFSGLRPTTM